MKRIAILAAGVSTAITGVSFGGGFENTTATLYYQLPFGGSTHETIPSYGFNVGYDVSVGTFGNATTLHRSLADFRFQENQLQQMKINGITLAVRNRETNELTIGDMEIDNMTAAIVGGLLVGGILCVTENLICENDDGSSSAPPPPAD